MPILALSSPTPLPPWLVLAGLLGVINAAACFMLIGRRVSRLAWYAVLGIFAACLGQVVGVAVQAPRTAENRRPERARGQRRRL